jgi:hypothetical protein
LYWRSGGGARILEEEPEFWKRLEYRISAEFAGLADRRLRYYWRDGLVREEYDLTSAERQISGVAWCGPSGQERWRFTLVAGQGAASRDRIDWPALLPGERLTGWLTPDLPKKTLRIEPLSGYDD